MIDSFASPTCDTPPQYQPVVRTVLETILWIAIIAAYIPQYLRIRRSGTTGISPYYVLNHSLFSTTTLALRCSHSIFYPAFNCLVSGELQGWKGYSAFLGFLAVIVQWLCAVMLVVVFICHRTTEPSSDLIEARWLPDRGLHPHKLTSRKMVIVLSSYVGATLPLSLALLCFSAHPYFQQEQPRRAFYVVFWSVWVALLCAADAFLVVFQFIKQMKTVGRLRTGGSLSIVSVGMQTVVLLLLSIAQFYRSRKSIILRKEPHMGFGRFVRVFVFVYGCFSVDIMYIVAGLGYLVLFQLCLLFGWNDMFGDRFGRIQLI
ncbi:uncharacterized protein BCR38DRAFT_519720 [Pseudomassariella vexata]|uniref:Uncharacterized protein n=1 Tax=Pseudomassariella vexata TaxID=1141098 RepID=A0A1Y2EI82_9PEZI|nr:uncharacterized protein BCR38DRAFT_519720 [Pseudomassariella vexata]ORY71288.1 hypothetical protein BCR38DRAFT_519720 [Pseudomassariella vexata]